MQTFVGNGHKIFYSLISNCSFLGTTLESRINVGLHLLIFWIFPVIKRGPLSNFCYSPFFITLFPFLL